jgi:hypothetical protein
LKAFPNQEQKEGDSIRYLRNGPKARFAAAFFAVFILAFLLTASVYSVINIDHDCIGEGCPICANIRALWSLLTYIAETVFFVFFLLAARFCIQRLMILYELPVLRLSSVRLFDRMND